MTSENAAVPHLLLGRKRRLDKLGILAFLRGIARDRSGMLELRRLCAEELRRSSIHNLRDDVVLELLAERYVHGALDLVEVHHPQSELPAFPEAASPPVAVKGGENKAGDIKPSPIVPQEYPVLARSEADQVIDSTLGLAAKLAALMFSAFGFNKRPSTLAEAYVSVSAEEGTNIKLAHDNLAIKLGLELHAFGADKPPAADVPDTYVSTATQMSHAPRTAVSGLSTTLSGLADTSWNRVSPEAAADAKKPDEEKKPEKTWIEFAATFADSGMAAASLALVVTLPSGEEKKVKTNALGRVRLDDLDDGAFSVSSEFKGKKRNETLAFGDVDTGASTPAKNDDADKVYCVVELKKHKVQTGDTLASLAESVGISADELAMWAFGTDDPKQVNLCLRHEIGCKKKGPDGKYVFDDADEPGIFLLPTPWKLEGLSGGKTVQLSVSKIAAKEKPWIFSM